MLRSVKGGLGRTHVVLLVRSLSGPAARAQPAAIVLVGRVFDAKGNPLASASVSIAALDGVENHVDVPHGDDR